MTKQTYPFPRGNYTFPADFTDHDLIVLAGGIMSEFAQSIEVLYQHEMPERMERLDALRREQRTIVGEKATEWIERLRDQGEVLTLAPGVESMLMQAFLAGWRSAPSAHEHQRPYFVVL